MRPRKPATTPCVYWQEERKQLFHACIAPWPLLQSTPFLHYSCPQVGYSTQQIWLNSQQPFERYGHSKFHYNFFVFFFLCSTGASISFHTLYKNCYNTQTCNSIASIFGTNEEWATVDSRTKFVVNLRNIQGVMNVYSRVKKRSNFCHGYRVNQV